MSCTPSLAEPSLRLTVWQKRSGRQWILSQRHMILNLVTSSARLGGTSTVVELCHVIRIFEDGGEENDSTAGAKITE